MAARSSRVYGLVVVTQTYDVVRQYEDREYVEVSPLVQIEPDLIGGHATRICQVSQIATSLYWTRIPGCTTDDERVAFAEALARKRRRFAFPNGFNPCLKKFRDRIKRKEGKTTPEGRLIAALDAIRAQPSPRWAADKVTVFFWFLLEAGTIIDFEASRKVIDNWMSLANFTTPFVLADPAFNLVQPQDMTVQDYRNSYPLDYDDVSL